MWKRGYWGEIRKLEFVDLCFQGVGQGALSHCRVSSLIFNDLSLYNLCVVVNEFDVQPIAPNPCEVHTASNFCGAEAPTEPGGETCAIHCVQSLSSRL